MKTKEQEIKRKIEEDPDFINSPRYDNSLAVFALKNDDGVDDSYISKVLLISEEEVLKLYDKAISSLKKIMQGNQDESGN